MNSGTPSTNEAYAQIGAIEAEAHAMGANDYEPTAFKLIREQLLSGELSPLEAVTQARGVVDSKQDYH